MGIATATTLLDLTNLTLAKTLQFRNIIKPSTLSKMSFQSSKIGENTMPRPRPEPKPKPIPLGILWPIKRKPSKTRLWIGMITPRLRVILHIMNLWSSQKRA